MRKHLFVWLVSCVLAHRQDSFASPDEHRPSMEITRALREHSDPVEALLAVKPELDSLMREPRLLQFLDRETWTTEGEKLRLHRAGIHYMDITYHPEHFVAGQPHLPNLTCQLWIKQIFELLSSHHMQVVLEKMTSFYNRYYYAQSGVESARWLHDYIQSIIYDSPMSTFISLEWHTHLFPQPSIVARFEPVIRNASAPLTIIGAHLDSANYFFPLLPAPGADDDMSGSISILEAFRVLAQSGYIPNTPIEFHWYAAEEAGSLGSLDIAKFKKESNAQVGAMMQFDMTAFIARNHTPSMVFITGGADDKLTHWALDLAKEYIDIPSHSATLPDGHWSDHMAFTRYGYPSSFACEGDPSLGPGEWGETEPYAHTTKDRMDINDGSGMFSIDHAKEFSKLAVAFAVEQGGWSRRHSREDDNKKDRRVW